jgi:hypothetical protein
VWTPAAVREHNPARGAASQGLEHLGFAVADVKSAKERFLKVGGKLIMGGCEGCTAHVDMRDTLGYIVELQPAPKQ